MDENTQKALLETANKGADQVGTFLQTVSTNAQSKSLDKTVDILNHGLEKAGQAVGKTIDFAAEQIPEILHQFLMWEIVRSVAIVVLCLLGLYISYRAFKYVGEAGRKAKIEEDKEMADLYSKEPETVNNRISLLAGLMHWDIGALVFVVGLGFADYNLINRALENGERAAKIWIAPKVFIIEKGVEVYKGYKNPAAAPAKQ